MHRMTSTRRLEYPRGAFNEVYALPPPLSTDRGGDEIDLRALLGTLLDHRRLILTVTGLCFVLALAYVFIATPVYEATAMVQVEQAPSIPGINAVAQAVGAANPAADDAVSILTSQSVIKKAVDDLNLNIVVNPYRIPLLGSLVARQYKPAAPGEVAAAWPGLSGYDWGGSRLDVSQLEVPADLYGEPLTLVAGSDGAYSLWQDSSLPFLRGRLLLQGQVGRPAAGSGVTMVVKSLQANPGTRFHVTRNYEVTTITELQKSVKAKQTSQDSSVIAVSLDSKSPHLAVAILDDITKAYLAQNVGRNSAQASSSLEFVRKQLPVVKKQLEDAQAKLNAYQLKAHSVDVPMQTQSLLTRLDTIDASVQQLETQRIAAARLYTPEHPEYKAIVSQIAQLNAQKASIDKQLNTMPDTQRELLNLNGNVQVLNNTYTGLLNEAQQLELAQAGTVGTARIVDEPSVDITRPAKPKKALTVLGGTFLGAFFSMAFVFARQVMKRTVEDPTEIKQLGLQVYASIPWSDEEQVISRRLDKRLTRRRPHKLLALAAPTDLATEALRSLRTSLTFNQHEAKNNLLMVCGSSPNAGKTFVSANLAAVVAQAGQRVLLIDANMRDGQLHKVFGGRAENGLSELIAGQILVEEAVRPVPDIENLDYVSCGAMPPNPSDLLMHPEFGALLRRCSAYYDLVVIDSPPILAVTDAAVIGRHVGTCLLVVRYGLNQASEIELAKERLMQSGVNVNGVIFNAVERRSTDYAYGFYDYRAV
ncbi:MAG: Tyrosine-protein kinase [Rhodanobacteraceae bacterium]|jgi:tyrosine-protein kinase Etk/Wzc|nr:MAG: Tyrosine-protein kinase [Rhodanobacteraceae bacterium]